MWARMRMRLSPRYLKSERLLLVFSRKEKIGLAAHDPNAEVCGGEWRQTDAIWPNFGTK